MKYLSICITLILATMFAVPAHAAFIWDTGNPTPEERYIGCVDDLVRMRADYEARLAAQDEAIADLEDQRGDAAALGVATGMFIGSGGVPVALGVVGGIVGSIPPLLLIVGAITLAFGL